MKRALITLVAVAACYDPVHLDAVAELGPEAPNVAPGSNHRPGQPCLTCHGHDGPAELELSAGGTIYAYRHDPGQPPPPPVAGAKITLTDGTGETRSFKTSEAGNFFVLRNQWDLAFPLRATVEVEAEGIHREMTTLIGRDGSCAKCHRESGDAIHMPGIFVRDLRAAK